MLYYGSAFLWIFLSPKYFNVSATAQFQPFPNSSIAATSSTTQAFQPNVGDTIFLSLSSTLSTTSWTSIGATRNASSGSVPAVGPAPQWLSSISGVTCVFVSTSNSTQLINKPNVTPTWPPNHHTNSSFRYSETGIVHKKTTTTLKSIPEPAPCIALDSSDDYFFDFIVVPSTNTITLASNATYSSVTEFTPPVYCPPGKPSTLKSHGKTDLPLVIATDFSPLPPARYSSTKTTTIFVTSKNPQVVCQYTPASFPGVPVTRIDKRSTSVPMAVAASSIEATNGGKSEGGSDNQSNPTPPSTTSMVVFGVHCPNAEQCCNKWVYSLERKSTFNNQTEETRVFD
ncbi:hypothetical protein EAF04_004586 [Stromatinia cepivora]|nr:hypothetical protein EAF04_004586 [Stromatinia cepivora]